MISKAKDMVVVLDTDQKSKALHASITRKKYAGSKEPV
jgi:hypothetical protein